MSVSRRAGRPCASVVSMYSGSLASGEPLPSGMMFSGRTTGRSLSATGRSRPSASWMTGIGQPQ